MKNKITIFDSKDSLVVINVQTLIEKLKRAHCEGIDLAKVNLEISFDALHGIKITAEFIPAEAIPANIVTRKRNVGDKVIVTSDESLMMYHGVISRICNVNGVDLYEVRPDLETNKQCNINCKKLTLMYFKVEDDKTISLNHHLV